jgi:hypothetical protein
VRLQIYESSICIARNMSLRAMNCASAHRRRHATSNTIELVQPSHHSLTCTRRGAICLKEQACHYAQSRRWIIKHATESIKLSITSVVFLPWSIPFKPIQHWHRCSHAPYTALGKQSCKSYASDRSGTFTCQPHPVTSRCVCIFILLVSPQTSVLLE